MNNIERERNIKLREQIKNDIKVVKLQKEIRKKNEQKLEDDLGIQQTLSEFHKPVIEELEKLDESRKQNLKAIKDAIADITPLAVESPKLEPIEYVKELFNKEPTYDPDAGLDSKYLKSEKLSRPTRLLDNPDKLDEMYAKAKLLKEELSRKRANLRSAITRAKTLTPEQIAGKEDEISDAKSKEVILELYLHRLAMIEGSKSMIVGKGLDEKLDILSQLTDKICKGSKCKKIYNQVVILLDILLKEGTLTNDQVKQYYEKFLS